MILTKLSKKRKFKNGMILRIYKIKKKCPERQTMTAISQSDIHISVDRASKKNGNLENNDPNLLLSIYK